MSTPTYKINVLHTSDIEHIDTSFLVNKYVPGTKIVVPTYSYLISGENIPLMLVDTGIKEDQLDIMRRLDMIGIQTKEMTYKAQLEKFGYTVDDVKVILHTHLHIDHSGNDRMFPQARIIMCRKELMFAVADLMDAQYPPEYITYLVEQIHVPGKVRMIDDVAQLAPGLVLEPTDGHTWGSMNIKVSTKDGLAIICGDVVYDEISQCRKNEVFTEVTAHNESCIDAFGDRSTGNYWNLWAAKTAVQKVVREADILLPMHDPLVLKKYGDTIG